MKTVIITALMLSLCAYACTKTNSSNSLKQNLASKAESVPCPTCTYKLVFTENGAECVPGGNDCSGSPVQNFTQAQLQQLQIFDSYFGSANLNPCDYFNNYDWTILFSCLSEDFISQIQNHGVSWCKTINNNGSIIYEAIPTTETCGTTNVLYAFNVKQ